MIVTPTERRTINGRFVGAWYDLGKTGLYLAHYRKSDKHGKEQLWLIEESVLEKAALMEYWVGVVAKEDGKINFYVTTPDEFFHSSQSRKVFKDWSYRGLPPKTFKINPLNRADFIAARAIIRR